MQRPDNRKKKRADVLMVEQGLTDSRPRAQALILAGKVYVDHKRIDKAGQLLKADTQLHLRGEDHPYVSRGGVKLAGAITGLDLDLDGKVAADFGASTGGFTDCLLKHGVSRVYAIDVGYGQLAEKLRTDARVINLERTNARYIGAGDLPEPMDLVVIDASFIGLAKLLPAAHAILKPNGQVIALVKPQFEVGRDNVGRGVVHDDQLRQQAVEEVKQAAVQLGYVDLGQVDSVLAGPKGNREIFLHLEKSGGSS